MTRLIVSVALCGAAVSCSDAGMPRTTARPPETRSVPVTDTIHGIEIVDDYRWLEGDNTDADNQGKVTPAVAAWTDAQNAYTREALDHLPGRRVLEDRLRPLMEVGAVSSPRIRGNRYFYSKREGAQNQPIVYVRERHDGPDRVLIDPTTLDPSGLTTIEWFSPSENGRQIA